ncbi:hypothetical protein Sjap_025446 [Stephania japonica]|uniref:Uncharacterized protein n=1 Tax=Stephania japonica TaxID=461633 RepID=A0AAP0HJK6_9MAGN
MLCPLCRWVFLTGDTIPGHDWPEVEHLCCASVVTLPGKSQRPLFVCSEACVPLMLRECYDIARKEPASSFRML